MPLECQIGQSQVVVSLEKCREVTRAARKGAGGFQVEFPLGETHSGAHERVRINTRHFQKLDQGPSRRLRLSFRERLLDNMTARSIRTLYAGFITTGWAASIGISGFPGHKKLKTMKKPILRVLPVCMTRVLRHRDYEGLPGV